MNKQALQPLLSIDRATIFEYQSGRHERGWGDVAYKTMATENHLPEINSESQVDIQSIQQSSQYDGSVVKFRTLCAKVKTDVIP